MSIRIFGLFVFIQLLALAPPRLAYAGDHDAHATPPAPQEAASCAADALDRLDRRTPVPLMALSFHRTADLIAEAARAKDVTGVLQTTAATVSVCTGCHETYKQQVVDENQWQRLTAPPGQTAR